MGINLDHDHASLDSTALIEAVAILKQGGVIAYPTEAVFGLGCDPFNPDAVERLLAIKQRPVEKGLILIAANWQQVAALTAPLTAAQLQPVFATWPGPITWVFPAAAKVPAWLRGEHTSIALRVTAHPLAHALCEAFDGPLVSTSANLSGQSPARTSDEARAQLDHSIDLILEGAVGQRANPTQIRDVLTGQILRF